MKITCDWHIHSIHSCDCRGRGMSMRQIIDGATAAGIAGFGVADHLHSRMNLPDIEAAASEFRAAAGPAGFHLGVEVTCMRQWELDEIDRRAAAGQKLEWGVADGPAGGPWALPLEEADVRRLGIEYVLGSVHWARGAASRPAAIEDYRQQYLFLIAHGLVDVLAHPWWWNGLWEAPPGRYEGPPWFDDFAAIPPAIHDELAAALVQHGVAAEINPGVLMTEYYPQPWRMRYLEHLGWLAGRGVKLAVGSDRHAAPYGNDFAAMGELLDRIGLRDEDLWRLPRRG